MLRPKSLAIAIALAAAAGLSAGKSPMRTAAASAASAPSTSIAPAALPQEAQLVEHGHYSNKAGAVVHSPAHSITAQVPAGASAKCRDGTYSFSRHHRGTCSHHGGVAAWQ